MRDAVDNFFFRQSRMRPRDLHDFVTAAHELLAEREPDLLDRTSHDWRHRKKRSLDDGNFHLAPGDACKIDRSESVACSISKRRAKQLRAFVRMASRSAPDMSIQRLSKR